MLPRAILLLLMLLALADACRAQEAPPAPGDIRSDAVVLVPAFVLEHGTVQSVQEWTWPDRSLVVANQVSLLLPGAPDLGPLLLYRTHQGQLVVGSQFLVGATPFFDALSFDGVRLVARRGPWSGSVWSGQTEGLDSLLTAIPFAGQALAGATVGYRPDPYRSFGLSLMPYGDAPGNRTDRTIAMVQAYFTDRERWSLLAGYGRDLGTLLPDEPAGSRDAYRLLATWNARRLSASASLFSAGPLFGPPAGFSDFRGQTSGNALARLQLARNLSLVEILQYNQFQVPGEVGGPVTSAHTLVHQMTWRPARRLELTGGLEQTQITADQARQDDTLFLRGTTAWSRLSVGSELRLDRQSDGNRSTEMHLQEELVVTPVLLVSLEQGYLETISPGGAATVSRENDAQVQLRFAENLGEVTLRGTAIDSTGLAPSTRSIALVLNRRLAGNLWLAGSVLQTTAGSQTFSSLGGRLRWIVSPHTEVVLEHAEQTPPNEFFIGGLLQPVGASTTLAIRTSWNGPTEQRLRRDLLGRIAVDVQAVPPGGSARPIGVAGVPVEVEARQGTTDEAGHLVMAGVEGGTHRVTLPPGALSSNYIVDGDRDRTVVVRPGRSAHVVFRATAFASVHAITWNDADGSKKLQTPYVPLAGLRVSVNGVPQSTAEDGTASYVRLAPGRYHVALDIASVPRGLLPTTPVEQDVDLKPGQDATIGFGLRGFGRLQGRARSVADGEREPGPPLGDVEVLLDGRPIGRTAADGRFDLRAPAGSHEVSLDPQAGAGLHYIVGAPLRVNVPPDGSVACDISVARYGWIDGSVSAPVSGIAVYLGDRFVYTDERGTFRFDHLPFGIYTLRLDPDTLPSSVRPAGPTQVRVDLASGEHRHITFPLKSR